MDSAECLRTLSTLASHGLTTRLLLTDLPALPLAADTASELRRLFAAARERRAFDVAVAGPGAEAAEWSRLVRRLRLEMGFPRGAPGRG